MNLIRAHSSLRLRIIGITSGYSDILHRTQVVNERFPFPFHFVKASPSRPSSQLTFLVHRLWKRIFMLIMNGDNSPIGSKIKADNFSTERLVTGRDCVLDQFRKVKLKFMHLGLRPNEFQVSSQIVPFATHYLLYVTSLLA